MFEDENGKLNGYCYSCGTYVADPLGEGKTIDDIPREKRTGLTKEEIAERMEFISTLGAQDLKVRRLRKDVLDYYGIKVGVSEEDGVTPNFVHFPYKVEGKLQSYKTRTLQVKAMWSVGNQKDVDLFGWEQAVKSTAKRLIIVEGEFDAPALKAIIDRYQDEKYKDLAPAVVSLPHGAGAAAKDIGRLADKIRKRFKEVVFCFDDDEAGRKATEECCKIMPTAMSVTLPAKDANDCILQGCQKAAFNEVMFNAKRPKNTSLVFGRDLHEDAKKPAEWGLSTPWDWLTDKTRGFRFGETWYLGAGEKMGKSEVVDTIIAHFLKEHKLPVLSCKPEQANIRTYKMVMNKLTGKVFHDPKVEFDEEAYDSAAKYTADNLIMMNLYQNVSWDTCKEDITYAATVLGAKAVFIDPITNFTNGKDATQVDAYLRGIAQEAAALALDLDIIIFFFCHLNKPKGGTPWDRGGKITTDYFAGSSGMARSCNYAVGLEGNKDPELSEIEQNTRKLVLLADREFGESGSVDLYWNRKTHLFNEMK